MPDLSFPKLGSARDATFSQHDEIDLANVFRVLWRRKLLIISVAGVLMAGGCLAVLAMTPKYTAEALVAVGVPSQESSLLYPGAGTPRPGVEPDVVATETEVLSARSLAKKAVEQLGLEHEPEFAGDVAAAARQPGLVTSAMTWLTTHGIMHPVSAAPDADGALAKLTDAFAQRLKVAAKGTSHVIAVSFTAKDRVLAAKAANAVVQTYVAEQIDRKMAASLQANIWIERRISALRDTANAAAAKRDAYIRDFGPMPEANGGSPLERELSDAVSRLAQGQSDLATLRARLARLNGSAASGGETEPTPDVVASPLMQALQQKATELQTQFADMSQRYGSDSPQFRGAQAGLAELRARIKSEAINQRRQLASEAAIAADKQAAQAAVVQDLRNQLPRAEQSHATFRALQQDVADSRAALESLVARERAVGTGMDGIAIQPEARIVSLADLPAQPSSPKTGLMLLLVGVFAISASAIVTFVAEAMDRRRLRSGDDIEAKMGLPVLGLVPVAGNRRASDVLHRRRRDTVRARRIWSEVASHPFSEYSEAIRRCANMLALTSGDARCSVVLVTSSQPREGKTTFAVSFACSAAQSGRRVLLIDADSHKPDVANNLGLRADVGLTDLLSGRAGLDDTVLPSEVAGLSVIAAAPAHLPLTSPMIARLGSLLPMLACQYELIVIDTAPVLAASETLLLSRLADATMFVVRWADTSGAIARVALKQLEMAGVEVRGAVLTMVNPDKHARYGYTDGVYYTKRIRAYDRQLALASATQVPAAPAAERLPDLAPEPETAPAPEPEPIEETAPSIDMYRLEPVFGSEDEGSHGDVLADLAGLGANDDTSAHVGGETRFVATSDLISLVQVNFRNYPGEHPKKTVGGSFRP